MRRPVSCVILSTVLLCILGPSAWGQPCVRCNDCQDVRSECLRTCQAACPDDNALLPATVPGSSPPINTSRCRQLGLNFGQQDVTGQACSATRRYCIIGPSPRPFIMGMRPCAKLAYSMCVGVALNRWPASCGANTTQPGLCFGGRWRDIYTFAITELCSRRARTILN